MWYRVDCVGVDSGRGAKRQCAEPTGAGVAGAVRQEGDANHHFHREPCGCIREDAREAPAAARVAGMIVHRNRCIRSAKVLVMTEGNTCGTVMVNLFVGNVQEVHACMQDAGTDMVTLAPIPLAKRGGSAKH